MHAALKRQLAAVERRLWTNDPVFYHDTLDEACVLVFPGVGVLSRDAAVDAIRAENADGRRWAEVHFRDLRGLMLTPDAALLTYHVAARWEHEERVVTALASSVYVKRDGGWKVMLHQQTAVGDELPGSA